MENSQYLKMQRATAEIVDKIKAKRLEHGIKDSKARIVAEAVSEFAKKELVPAN